MKVRGLSPSDVGLPDLERCSTRVLVSEVVKPTWNQVCLEVGDCGWKTSQSNTQAGTPISRDLRACRRFIKDAKSAAMSYSHLCLEFRPLFTSGPSATRPTLCEPPGGGLPSLATDWPRSQRGCSPRIGVYSTIAVAWKLSWPRIFCTVGRLILGR